MDTLKVEPGQMICVVGHGMAAGQHAHYIVKRTTKTLFVVSRMVQDREVERRYRYHGREVGSHAYGGTMADVKCQHKTGSV